MVATPRKCPGRDCAVEAVTEDFNIYESGGAGGVELLDWRGEDDICARGCGEGAIGVEGAGIAGVVLIRAELRGVDEDADGDMSA